MKNLSIHEILPPEMVEKIIKLLNYKDIYPSQLVCIRWKEIIAMGNLKKKASGMTSTNLLHFSIWYIKSWNKNDTMGFMWLKLFQKEYLA